MNAAHTEAPSALIEVGDPEARGVPDVVLDAPGGFAWWYVDALDERGDGAVLIWSWGLPFLPGYLSGARSGAGDPARARPSFNVALYEGGKPAFYILQTYHPDDVETDGQGSFRFGATRITRPTPGRVDLAIDLPVPRSRSRLQGALSVSGSPARLGDGLAPSPRPHHRWTPVFGPSRLSGQLTCGDRVFDIDAPAYHDRNEGDRRFDDLGIDHWIWGRLISDERTRIWYICYAKTGPATAWGVELARDGTLRLFDELEPRLIEPRRGAFGMRTWRQVQLIDRHGRPFVTAQTRNRVDDGFFYARTVVEAEAEGHRGLGIAEWIVPDRIDLARHRPLVEMAVHRTESPSSFWLPLFSGPREGRLARLLGLGDARPRLESTP